MMANQELKNGTIIVEEGDNPDCPTCGRELTNNDGDWACFRRKCPEEGTFFEVDEEQEDDLADGTDEAIAKATELGGDDLARKVINQGLDLLYEDYTPNQIAYACLYDEASPREQASIARNSGIPEQELEAIARRL